MGWIKSDEHAILAIEDMRITRNPRFSATYDDSNTWKLHIKGAQLSDAGTYSCHGSLVGVCNSFDFPNC